ncbi:hypothetical protein GCM10009540_03330 [Streptomyces turgidiscabies]
MTAAVLEPGEVTMSAVAADTAATAAAILFLVPDFMAFGMVTLPFELRSLGGPRPANSKWSVPFRNGPRASGTVLIKPRPQHPHKGIEP